jgi:hypothetical protein
LMALSRPRFLPERGINRCDSAGSSPARNGDKWIASNFILSQG